MRLIGQLVPPKVMMQEISYRRLWQEVLVTDNRFAVIKHKVPIITDGEADDRQDEEDDAGKGRRKRGERQTVIP